MNWLWVDHGGMDWSEYTHAYCYERRKTNIYDHSGTPDHIGTHGEGHGCHYTMPRNWTFT
jgi:hypothetical protein